MISTITLDPSILDDVSVWHVILYDYMLSSIMIKWQIKKYSELSKDELYEILKLRMEVFILEQKSLYLDLDGIDNEALHFMGLEEDRLVAYLRVTVPKSSSIAYIRRVVVNPNFRQQGLGNILMHNALKYIHSLQQVSSIELDAQSHLQSFYGKFGFEAVGDSYDDGGILHINMKMTREKYVL